MRNGQGANVVTNQRLVSEVRREFPTPGDLVDIFQSRKNDVAYAGLHGRICKQLAKREFGIALRFELGRHQVSAVGAVKCRNEFLLVAEAEGRNHNFRSQIRQIASCR